MFRNSAAATNTGGWRAALGLAQSLRNEQVDSDESGEPGIPLSDRPEVVEALTTLLRESLASNSTLEEDFKHQEFLARTMGSLNGDELVMPVLAEVLKKNYPETQGEGDHRAVHKSALMALAMIAGRKFESRSGSPAEKPDEAATGSSAAGTMLETPTIDNAAVAEQLRLAAQDSDPSIRHLAAYVLGLVSGPDAIRQLRVMLLDGDRMTQANAAVALARNGQHDGVATFSRLLATAAEPMDRAEFAALSPEDQQRVLAEQSFEEPIILRNTIRAVGSLWNDISDEDRVQLTASLQKLADNHSAADIRLQARKLLDEAP
ncbi:MAG: HEAT repeat domain-containing protein [Planctomycetaceae bacterium]